MTLTSLDIITISSAYAHICHGLSIMLPNLMYIDVDVKFPALYLKIRINK